MTFNKLKDELKKEIKKLKEDMPFCKISMNDWELEQAKLQTIKQCEEMVKKVFYSHLNMLYANGGNNIGNKWYDACKEIQELKQKLGIK